MIVHMRVLTAEEVMESGILRMQSKTALLENTAFIGCPCEDD